MTVKTFK